MLCKKLKNKRLIWVLGIKTGKERMRGLTQAQPEPFGQLTLTTIQLVMLIVHLYLYIHCNPYIYIYINSIISRYIIRFIEVMLYFLFLSFYFIILFILLH